MVKKRPELLKILNLGILPQSQQTEAVVQSGQSCISCWQPNVVMGESCPSGTGVESINGS